MPARSYKRIWGRCASPLFPLSSHLFGRYLCARPKIQDGILATGGVNWRQSVQRWLIHKDRPPCLSLCTTGDSPFKGEPRRGDASVLARRYKRIWGRYASPLFPLPSSLSPFWAVAPVLVRSYKRIWGRCASSLSPFWAMPPCSPEDRSRGQPASDSPIPSRQA